MENIDQLRSKWNNRFRYEHDPGENQRENNVTKSLLNVLQDTDHGVSESVLPSLLYGIGQPDFEFRDVSTQI